MSSCLAQENMDMCIQLHTRSIHDSCYANNGQNYKCLCDSIPALAGCYDNCPSDMGAMGRKENALAEREAYCRAASQGSATAITETSSVVPSPTINAFFAVSSDGASVTINAGPTQVIAPIRGGEPNFNTPFAGSLYHSYTLGSLTIGYSSASMKYAANAYNSTSSSDALSSKPIPTLTLTPLLAILAYFAL
ncbi:hypothetical protein DSO57_1009128 [Entomophthora muscae]|nr:hypothetical protein DSO57_1009128 [Entomophthora muscae]